MPRVYMKPRIRKQWILVAALDIAGRPGGWSELTAVGIAREAKCTPGLVFHYLGSIACINREVVKAAIKQELFDILIQALIANHPEAARMKPLLKQKAFAHVAP